MRLAFSLAVVQPMHSNTTAGVIQMLVFSLGGTSRL
jgi:hypothetical protein